MFAPHDDDRCIRARSGCDEHDERSSGSNDNSDSFERLFRNLRLASAVAPRRSREMDELYAQKIEVER